MTKRYKTRFRLVAAGANRSVLAPVAALLLVAYTSGCGGSSRSGGQASTAGRSSSANSSVAASASEASLARLMTVDRDKDNDIEASHDDTVNRNAEFGRPASDSDRRAIVALLKRYYRAALAENGAKACSMLYSTIAESVPEDYGSFAGPAYMRGNTCPTVLTKLFEHFHKLLAIELPKMTVMAVRLEEHHGLALLRFGRLPERQIAVAREGRTWRISALLDGELT